MISRWERILLHRSHAIACYNIDAFSAIFGLRHEILYHPSPVLPLPQIKRKQPLLQGLGFMRLMVPPRLNRNIYQLPMCRVPFPLAQDNTEPPKKGPSKDYWHFTQCVLGGRGHVDLRRVRLKVYIPVSPPKIHANMTQTLNPPHHSPFKGCHLSLGGLWERFGSLL